MLFFHTTGEKLTEMCLIWVQFETLSRHMRLWVLFRDFMLGMNDMKHFNRYHNCQERGGRGLKCRGNQGFNNKIKQKNKPPRRGKTNKQAGRHKTGAQSTWNTHDVRQRISTGLQTQGDYIGRQTRVMRETQLEPLKQWLSNKMGGDRQSTWEHMALNKQQAMCSTHRDIWWPAWAHQQDRDITPPLRSGSQTLHTHTKQKNV